MSASAAKVVRPKEFFAFNKKSLEEAMAASCDFLLRIQKEDGHWEEELEVDCTLCADYITYMHWRGDVDRELEKKCAAEVRKLQTPQGGWNIYRHGPAELNASVKGYLALKLAGDSPDAAWMRDARADILRLGGIPEMNTYGKLYLALLGIFPWKHLPAIPVEIFLLPISFPINLFEMSSWTRAIIGPLAILNHYKPTHPLPADQQLHELFPAGTEDSDLSLKCKSTFWSWENFFLKIDFLLKLHERLPWKPLRKLGLCRAKSWMLDRMGEGSEGLGAIYPAMLNAMIALQALGYKRSHPIFQKAERDFAGLFLEDKKGFRIQPCLSPVWDTAITTMTLAEAGLHPESSELQTAVTWLEEREVRFRGDWKVKNPHPEASGWAFEHGNKYYADTDDTMMVLMALRLVKAADCEKHREVQKRAWKWLLSFQCKDGGWAAFDKDVTQHWLEDVPFADHNAMLDPTCSDLTARVMELGGKLGCSKDEKWVRRALAYLKSTQETDGSWYGRWGVNYTYGTWQALRGLAAIGMDMQEAWIIRARDWLESAQNEDGGWGETCASYDDPDLKGLGPSTPSQTAWALMGLCACGQSQRESIERGVQWLIDNQNAEGTWDEDATTGTGFPCVFYLKYEMYRHHFPLLALAAYKQISKA
ncbi:MAG: squalene--hopene cyclase [Chthoniobacterales bacterium]